ncbi:hypothetical protein A3F23_02355 [Candidatus Giovannonibacteria bacterium RIFCSPHIGHO2_12_FULL_43_15]|uniref:Uncharacterized protein n=1 Tax=Candidatus Giovannonibacteria bacterium RIFCSPHIGHO2_12_FULL_43_15 TaxID=1798341 RepID=A0A1F5WRJ9_9BACT|nr:MAG: hypothetical protein A3F23_02355 [Candidatus Giovannonibacteria bacterium RIFCSPHIGHO2_12_FULL_43_15]OGF78755.1 MAG: hypothetical protein A3A15_00845 [Candidatus Giovannonibacteria bacterium RIFCSPLOWO2_01_FULL_43_60]
MKPRDVWMSVFAVLLFGFLLSQNALATIAWQKYRNARAAIILTKDDKLALEIGNHYFNGAGGYDLEKSERAFKKAVQIDSKILWGHYQLARIYLVRGERIKALSEINKELDANPENLRALYIRALINSYNGNFNSAEKDFRNFVSWAPKEWAGHNDLAWVLLKQGKYQEAEDALEIAFQDVYKSEENSWLWNSLGVAELNLRKYKTAEASFRKARELAETITLEEWSRAYPGNNPAESEKGFSDFKRAIEENLKRSSVDKAL